MTGKRVGKFFDSVVFDSSRYGRSKIYCKIYFCNFKEFFLFRFGIKNTYKPKFSIFLVSYPIFFGQTTNNLYGGTFAGLISIRKYKSITSCDVKRAILSIN